MYKVLFELLEFMHPHLLLVSPRYYYTPRLSINRNDDKSHSKLQKCHKHLLVVTDSRGNSDLCLLEIVIFPEGKPRGTLRAIFIPLN